MIVCSVGHIVIAVSNKYEFLENAGNAVTVDFCMNVLREAEPSPDCP